MPENVVRTSFRDFFFSEVHLSVSIRDNCFLNYMYWVKPFVFLSISVFVVVLWSSGPFLLTDLL